MTAPRRHPAANPSPSPQPTPPTTPAVYPPIRCRLCDSAATVRQSDTEQHRRCVEEMKRAATAILMPNLPRP